MRVKDEIRFGSNATAALGTATEEKITWRHNSQTEIPVDSNDAIELIEMGCYQDLNGESLFVRDRDNTDWFSGGFWILGASGAYGGNELQYDSRPDWSKVRAPITPDTSRRSSPTFKMSEGDKLRIVVKGNSSQASVAKYNVVAVTRRLTAQNPGERSQVAAHGATFGGIQSNAQYYHEAAKSGATTASTFNAVVTTDILKSELYAYNNLGQVGGTGNGANTSDIWDIRIDDKYTYNEYLASYATKAAASFQDMLPLVDLLYNPAQASTRLAAARPYVFDKPVVGNRRTNKQIRARVYGTSAVTVEVPDINIYARLRGMRYKVSA